MSPTKVTAAPARHPLDAATPEEITSVGAAVRTHLTEKLGVKAFRFLSLFLKEPSKADVLEAGFFPGGSASQGSSRLQRQFYVHLHDIVKGDAYEITTTIDAAAGVSLDHVEKLKEGVQPSLTIEELCFAEELCRKDERVVKAAADVGVSKEELFCDGWSIGWDSRFPGRRLQQCLTYARYGKDQHLYGHPLDFMPVVDCITGEVLAIDFPPHRTNKDNTLSSDTTAPPSQITFDAPTDRPRLPPPTQRHDYHPETASASVFSQKSIEMRKGLKPLSVVQPEGVSFKLNGGLLEWQKWKLHLAFHPREGMVLSTVSYADDEAMGASKAQPKERPLFYRLSVSEMVVPYGEPAWPHYKKHAFDVGEYGLGYLANSLSLGCDCLGTIQYLDGHFIKHDGGIETVKNAICIHEEDDGMLWKHTDYRPNGRSHNVRARKLVISMVCTVANYEYKLAFSLHQDGNIELEINLSGILNLYTLAEGESPAGFGTEVAPRINAHYHQHLFSVRIDPHLDGPRNSIQEQEIQALPYPTGSKENWAGNGFTTNKRILKTAGEGVRDANPYDERSWTIVNENEKHYSTKGPVGYKIMSSNMPRLYAKPDSIVAIRAPFAKHHIWTVPYKDDRLQPAGRFPVQTMEVQEDSIEKWIGDGTDNIANEDIVTFVTVGTTHIPRAEDFPIMPVEKVRLTLKPVNFFSRNPALDVPATNDAQSVAASAHVPQANGNGSAANGNGKSSAAAAGYACCH